MKNNKPDLLVIAGPTGVGKSKIAVKVAEKINGEIISADSMQIYKSMDIGTAKATPEQRKAVKHHLLDIKEPGENFDVNTYQILARKAIDNIRHRNKMPMLVGGTGLYIRAVLLPLEFPPKDLTGEIRKRFEAVSEQKGPEYLWAVLKKKDKAAALKIEKTDKRRIIRALEVIDITGKPFSDSYFDWSKSKPLYNAISFGLIAERPALYDRINKRVDAMISQGLADEVEALLSKGFYEALTARQAIGYKEIVRFIDGEISFEQAVENIKTATRNYAKRQITWFRSDPQITWIDTTYKSVDSAADEILKKVKEFNE